VFEARARPICSTTAVYGRHGGILTNSEASTGSVNRRDAVTVDHAQTTTVTSVTLKDFGRRALCLFLSASIIRTPQRSLLKASLSFFASFNLVCALFVAFDTKNFLLFTPPN
jgi:hypothetical protein